MISLHRGFFLSIAVLGGLVSAQHVTPPTRATGMYDMTTWTPIAQGTCSGEGAGCTTMYGFDFLSDGRMVVLTNDYLGHDQKPASRPRAKVSLISTPIGSASTVTTIASHFKQPGGIKVVNDKIWVSDMDTLYTIPNNNPTPADTISNRTPRFGMPLSNMYNGDQAPTSFAFNKATCSGLTCTSSNSQAHHYIFTPVYYQGKFYAAYGGNTGSGSGLASLNASSYYSGAILRWDSTTTQLDSTANRFAGGLRSPDGTALGPDGSMFVTDHQGSWLPMCTLTRYKVGAAKMQFGGYRQDNGYTPNFAQAWYDRGQADYVPPLAINRYDQAGKTGWVGIAQSYYLTQGPYSGQLLVGDINSRGLWRVAIDTLPDTTGTENYQGAVFYFTPGNSTNTLGTGAAGINRLIQGTDGTIYAGAGRTVGNWAGGMSNALIYVFKPKPSPTQFEILKIRSLKDGYELVFNKKINPKSVVADSFRVAQRSWVRQSSYGMGFSPVNSPNQTTGTPVFTPRTIDSVQVSLDSLRIRLKVSGVLRLNQGKRGDSTTHWHTMFRFYSKLRSATGDTIYNTEADYAQNWINTTRSWDGGKLAYTSDSIVVGLRQPTLLQGKVWFTHRPGFVNVNVDNMKPYAVVVRDLHGRVVDRKAGSAGVPLQIRAPGATQAVYTIEIRSEGESYRKIVTF